MKKRSVSLFCIISLLIYFLYACGTSPSVNIKTGNYSGDNVELVVFEDKTIHEFQYHSNQITEECPNIVWFYLPEIKIKNDGSFSYTGEIPLEGEFTFWGMFSENSVTGWYEYYCSSTPARFGPSLTTKMSGSWSSNWSAESS